MDWTPFWVSFHLGLWVTALLLVLSFPLAWLFVARSWVWLESFLSLPMVLSPSVLGFYLLVTLAPFHLAFTFPAVVIAGCVAGLPYMVSGLKTGLDGIPRPLIEASLSLGLGRVATFWRVVLPNMRVALVSAMALTFARTLGEFGVVLMVGGSIPGVTKVVSIALYEKVESLDFATVHLYALTLIAVSYPAVYLLNWLQRKKRA